MRYPKLARLFSGRKKEIEPAVLKTEDGCEITAVIAAALYEYMRTSPGVNLKVVSIKRTGQRTPLWNRIGRFERISGKL